MPIAPSELEQHRSYLTAYALRRVGDSGLAEDLVQDTFVAALGAGQNFRGDSSPRTWLTGILKHKIVDAIRRQAREPVVSAEADEEVADFDELFTERGHWNERPAAWGNPDSALEQSQFFRALELCLARLPGRTAQAFMMREHLGLETGEICKELGITPTHCWVMLYRARMTLRECLQQTWFAK